VLIPCNDEKRWAQFFFANHDDMAEYQLELRLKQPNCLVKLSHAPLDFYSTWDLHLTEHAFVAMKCQVETQEHGPYFHVPSTASGTARGPDIVVARPGGTIFDEKIDINSLDVDLRELIHFAISVGEQDPSRSSGGFRVDGGCAGQSQEPGTVNRPKSLCGQGYFERYDAANPGKGPLVRAMLGRLLDRMHFAAKASADCEGKMFAHNLRRFSEFSQKFRDYLWADHFCFEWYTIQLLNVTHGHTGVYHRDKWNCVLVGYNQLVCLSFFIVDGVGK
jgi:hypothetical protein